MSAAPLPRGLRPRGAANFESGLEPRQDIRSHLKSQELARLHRQRLVARIHDLGPRAVFELVDELDRHHGLGDDLDRRLQRYADADPELLHAFGADRFAPLPTRVIEAGR
jgi:hypothetical protein